MQLFKYSVLLLVLVSCQKETKTNVLAAVLQMEDSTANSIDNDSILYFENALIYEIDVDGKKQEIWFYVNEEKSQILFVPKDEMIKAVISFPNGEYKIYGIGEFKDNFVLSEKIEAVVDNFIDETVLKSNKQTKVISQKSSYQKDIICNGFTMNYQQMEGSETLFATTQIPINALQIYGFARLEGDALFPINIDYLNVFKKNQLFTHIYYPQLALRLIAYESNPYEFDTSGYKQNK
jgi:hypothetical protein